MVGVADPEGFAGPGAVEADLGEVEQGHGEHEERCQYGEGVGVLPGVKVREDGEDGEQIAGEMAAGIAEKGAGLGEIIGEEAE